VTFNAVTRTFSGTPPLNFNGAIDLKVTASDGAVSVSDTFRLTITPVNDAPVVVNAIADQSQPEDQPWTFQVPANAFSDADGDALTYSASLGDGSALPSWLTFNAATRTFSGTPPLNFRLARCRQRQRLPIRHGWRRLALRRGRQRLARCRRGQ
jgi:hypothetical protein